MVLVGVGVAPGATVSTGAGFQKRQGWVTLGVVLVFFCCSSLVLLLLLFVFERLKAIDHCDQCDQS